MCIRDRLQHRAEFHPFQSGQRGNAGHHPAADHTGHAHAHRGQGDVFRPGAHPPDAVQRLAHNGPGADVHVFPAENFARRVRQSAGVAPLIIIQRQKTELAAVKRVQMGGPSARGPARPRRKHAPLGHQFVYGFAHRHQRQAGQPAQLRFGQGAAGAQQRLHRVHVHQPKGLRPVSYTHLDVYKRQVMAKLRPKPAVSCTNSLAPVLWKVSM